MNYFKYLNIDVKKKMHSYKFSSLIENWTGMYLKIM